MKKKINNRGFTLIELIATIALLAVIALISFVSITKVLESGKVSDCEVLVNNIKSMTKEYVSDNRYEDTFTDIGSEVPISISTLISGNYLSSPILDPFTEENIESKIRIGVILNDDYTAREVRVYNGNGEEVNCDNKKW